MNNRNIHGIGMWMGIVNDIVMLTIGYMITGLIFWTPVKLTAPIYMVFVGVILLFLFMLDAYDDLCSYMIQKQRLPITLAVTFVLSCISTAIIGVLFSFYDSLSVLFHIVFFVIGYVLLLIGRKMLYRILIKYRKSQSMLILYFDGCPKPFLNKLTKSAADFGCIKHFKLTQNDVESKALYAIDSCDCLLLLANIPQDLINKYVLYSLEKGKTIQVIPSLENLSFMDARIRHIGDTPVIALKNAHLMFMERAIKRMFDIIASLIGIVVTSPIMALCAAAIKLNSNGPVFYKQERYTIHKKRFNIYKFRTMVQDAEKYGARLATENDDRITSVGKILRACRLDELPQLLNILKGDMSFVGPRPERPIYADKYSKMVKSYDVRYLVKAGLTGYAQIYGQYNTKVSDKVLFDSIYINNFSLWLDMKLMVQTSMIMFIKESTEGVDEEYASVPQKKDEKNEMA